MELEFEQAFAQLSCRLFLYFEITVLYNGNFLSYSRTVQAFQLILKNCAKKQQKNTKILTLRST
jgi:hypothetical protein